MSKKDNISKRMSHWRELIDRLSPQSMRRLLGPDHFISPMMAARDLKSSKPLLDAFNYFRLEPKRLPHQELLLRILAEVCFNPKPRHRPKGTKKWDNSFYLFLADCYESVKLQGEGLVDERAAELIKQHFPDFKHISLDAIRRRLPEARRMKKLQKPIKGLLSASLKQGRTSN
jgi:hypothetical protein